MLLESWSAGESPERCLFKLISKFLRRGFWFSRSIGEAWTSTLIKCPKWLDAGGPRTTPREAPASGGEHTGGRSQVREGVESGPWNSQVVLAVVYRLFQCSNCKACAVKNSPNTPDRKKTNIKALITLMVVNGASLNRAPCLCRVAFFQDLLRSSPFTFFALEEALIFGDFHWERHSLAPSKSVPFILIFVLTFLSYFCYIR